MENRRSGRSAQAVRDSVRPSLSVERLEERQFLSINPGAAPVGVAGLDEAPEIIGESFGLTDEASARFQAEVARSPTIAIDLPEQLADELRIEIEVDGETQTLVLERGLSTRGSAFQVLVQQDDGSLVEFNAGEEGNYVGYIEERPGIRVSAIISSRGLTAEAHQLNGEFVWEINPTGEVDANGDPVHRVNSSNILALLDFNHDHDGDGVADHADGEHPDDQTGGGHGPDCTCTACSQAQAKTVESALPEVAPIDSGDPEEAGDSDAPQAVVVGGASDAEDRAVVFNEVNVREVTVGFDVTHESFTSSVNGGSVQAVLDNIALFLNTDETVAAATTSPNAIYLRDGLVHQVAGLIIIRSSEASDPYADANGNANLSGDLLNQFRDRWNGNADSGASGTTFEGETGRLQSDHDHVTLLGGAGSELFNGSFINGLAFVGTVNEFNRYSISDGATTAGLWRSVARHEIGHTFGLSHFGGSGRRAEFDPGGNGIGILDPTGQRNGLTTDEQTTVLAEVNSSNLELVNAGTANAGTFTLHNVRPNAVRDDVLLLGSGPFVIDVLANDFDANNDPLFLDRFENVSEAGGTISLSVGTGDQGQDQLIYTPPANFTGEDSFFYFAGDIPQFGTGNSGNPFTQFGLVSITVETTEILLDPTITEFDFDFGTIDSPVLQNADFDGIQVTSETTGDVFFTRGGQPVAPEDIGSFDRGSIPGINTVNQDAITSTEPLTVNFAVPNGQYNVALNLSDPILGRLNQTVTAEGQLVLSDVDNPVGTNVTQAFIVDVVDGLLNLTFDDLDAGAAGEFALNRVSLQRLATFEDPLLLGDFNADRVVNAADFVTIRDTIGRVVDQPFDESDHDGSGVIDVGDIGVFADNFGSALVETTLIDANNGNGDFTDLTPNSGEDLVVDLSIGRVFAPSGTTGDSVTIPGFVITRAQFQGGNDAFGFDSVGPLSDGDDDPVAFVNSDTATLTTDGPIGFDFSDGDLVELSFDLGTDTSSSEFSGATAQASLIFNEGTVDEFTQQFELRTATFAEGEVRFTESVRLTEAASTVSVSIDLGQFNPGGPGVQRVLLDDIELGVLSPVSTSSVAADFAGTPQLAAPAIEPGASTPEPLGNVVQAVVQDQVLPPLPALSASGALPGGSAPLSAIADTLARQQVSDELLTLAAIDNLPSSEVASVIDRDGSVTEALAEEAIDLGFESFADGLDDEGGLLA